MTNAQAALIASAMHTSNTRMTSTQDVQEIAKVFEAYLDDRDALSSSENQPGSFEALVPQALRASFQH